ncbi:hypothetical protein AB0H71_28840 [Nocardia sp. NPDC050697]|uniref:hypothetical protein n=1 Tax=Nocardia sp. NPDC050697 TaxID=3155158 RepID=UPI0033C254C3
MERKIIITEQGQQIPVEAPHGVTVSVLPTNDAVADEVVLDVTEKQFGYLQKQAVTNDISAVILRSKKATN